MAATATPSDSDLLVSKPKPTTSDRLVVHVPGTKQDVHVTRGRFKTWWETPATVTIPRRPGDFRDMLPPPNEQVALEFASVVHEGQWTLGLCEMWGKRAKPIKAAVHMPCWESFRVNPCLWRGPVCGRTCQECYWYGNSKARWARMVQAVGLGREYTVPFADVGSGYHGEICTLCWFTCALTMVLSLGVGQAVTCCGSEGLSCAACYTCHAREKLRRKFRLPPTFGLPPGFDDCCVHFWCHYCASHQEMREVVLRGLDGPGLHALDLVPDSWKHNPGWEDAVKARKARLKELELLGVTFLPLEERIATDHPQWRYKMFMSRQPTGQAGGAMDAPASVTASGKHLAEMSAPGTLEMTQTAAPAKQPSREYKKSYSVAY